MCMLGNRKDGRSQVIQEERMGLLENTALTPGTTQVLLDSSKKGFKPKVET